MYGFSLGVEVMYQWVSYLYVYFTLLFLLFK
jgi:hypothetical protein